MFNIRVYGILINDQEQILVSDELVRGTGALADGSQTWPRASIPPAGWSPPAKDVLRSASPGPYPVEWTLAMRFSAKASNSARDTR